MADEFSYEITQKYGVLSTSKSGWTMELNSVAWNGRSPKYDLRSWSPDHEKMGKGVTLTTEEVTALKALLDCMQLLTFPLSRTSKADGAFRGSHDSTISKTSILR